MQIRVFLISSFFTVAGMTTVVTTAARAGDYLLSAHGNSTTYGVSRLDLATANFSRGNCAHCHEQHASIGGSEPDPVTGAKEYLLFAESNTDQATNFCFNCHVGVGGYQSGGAIVNRSYSFRAGGWTTDSLNNVKDAFSLASQLSSHNLADIVNFAGATARGWKYNSTVTGDPNGGDSNACAVCHDPHLVQGDPPTAPNAAKTSGTRGGAITEINSAPVKLWGNVAGEKMSDYTGSYQAPLRFSGNYEPDGNTVSDPTTLPDYNTFCTTCHNAGNAVYSTERSGNLKVIDWNNISGEIHGKGAAVDISMLTPAAPYSSGTTTSYVLSCLDCHEPHGSGNIYLLRGEVNGALTNAIATGFDFDKICKRCHNPTGGAADWDDVHHALPDSVYSRGGSCDTAGCHSSPAATRINCENCHFHGSDTNDPGVLAPDNPVGFRVTF